MVTAVPVQVRYEPRTWTLTARGTPPGPAGAVRGRLDRTVRMALDAADARVLRCDVDLAGGLSEPTAQLLGRLLGREFLDAVRCPGAVTIVWLPVTDRIQTAARLLRLQERWQRHSGSALWAAEAASLAAAIAPAGSDLAAYAAHASRAAAPAVETLLSTWTMLRRASAVDVTDSLPAVAATVLGGPAAEPSDTSQHAPYLVEELTGLLGRAAARVEQQAVSGSVLLGLRDAATVLGAHELAARFRQ